MSQFEKGAEALKKLIEVVKQLRTPETGCPWDLEQDHRSLRPYLIEEAYEVLQAIDRGEDEQLCDELGDLLLQVVLHSQVAQDRGAFQIADVAEAVTEKMIRRHPHVFGDLNLTTSEEVLKNWELIKSTEGNGKAEPQSFSERLADIPASLPSLLRAQRLGEKAAKVHFDWESLSGVITKVREEIGELEAELKALPGEEEGENLRALLSEEQKLRLEHELGDALFSLCQLARWLGLSAEDSLRSGSDRFLRRFSRLERYAERSLTDLSPAELEALWQKAKEAEED